jgi:hypothetical protein
MREMNNRCTYFCMRRGGRYMAVSSNISLVQLERGRGE